MRKFSQNTRVAKEVDASMEYAVNNPDASPDDAFMRGVEWADEHPHWISIEDELPPRLDEDLDVSITVIVCDEVNIGFGEYDFDKLKWFSDIRSVTHWMPIPKPPKKGE